MNYLILPADNYIVINKSIITDEDFKILNMLYLPLTGPLAIMLYNMLVNDLNKSSIVSENLTHSHLLSNLHVSSAHAVTSYSSKSSLSMNRYL